MMLILLLIPVWYMRMIKEPRIMVGMASFGILAGYLCAAVYSNFMHARFPVAGSCYPDAIAPFLLTGIMVLFGYLCSTFFMQRHSNIGDFVVVVFIPFLFCWISAVVMVASELALTSYVQAGLLINFLAPTIFLASLGSILKFIKGAKKLDSHEATVVILFTLLAFLAFAWVFNPCKMGGSYVINLSIDMFSITL